MLFLNSFWGGGGAPDRVYFFVMYVFLTLYPDIILPLESSYKQHSIHTAPQYPPGLHPKET